MRANRIRTALAENGIAIGALLMEFGSRGVPKILEYADIDFVLIDMEHSAFGIEHVADLIAWFKATPIAPVVRVPQNLYHFLSGVLDAGALGVQVANVESADEARGIVEMVKYEPMGKRGLGLTAAHSDFRTPKASEYLPAVNAATMVMVQIESAKGVENVDEIAAVEGVDTLVVGSNDLTNALGIHGQLDHPRFKDALERVTAAARRHGKSAKITGSKPDEIAWYYDLGFRILGIRPDVALFRDAVKGAADMIRAAAKPR